MAKRKNEAAKNSDTKIRKEEHVVHSSFKNNTVIKRQAESENDIIDSSLKINHILE